MMTYEYTVSRDGIEVDCGTVVAKSAWQAICWVKNQYDDNLEISTYLGDKLMMTYLAVKG